MYTQVIPINLGDLGEVDATVEFDIESRGRPAKLSGNPDDRYEEEPREYNIISIIVDGADFTSLIVDNSDALEYVEAKIGDALDNNNEVDDYSHLFDDIDISNKFANLKKAQKDDTDDELDSEDTFDYSKFIDDFEEDDPDFFPDDEESEEEDELMDDLDISNKFANLKKAQKDDTDDELDSEDTFDYSKFIDDFEEDDPDYFPDDKEVDSDEDDETMEEDVSGMQQDTNVAVINCENILQQIMQFLDNLAMCNDTQMQNDVQCKMQTCGFTGDSIEEFENFMRCGGDNRVSKVHDVFFNQSCAEDVGLENGYGDNKTVDTDDYFPTGSATQRTSKAGPSSARNGDNPLSVRMFSYEDINEECDNMMEEYNKFVAEYNTRNS